MAKTGGDIEITSRHMKFELVPELSAHGVADMAGHPATAVGRADVKRPDGLSMPAAGERARLGELLRATERITSLQLEEALAEQQRNGRMLGEILLDHGSLTVHELKVVLEYQRRQAAQSPTAGRLYLGNLLVAAGHITRQQLVVALKWQVDHGVQLGVALVECGYATERQVKYGLSLQRKLVVAALIGAMTPASVPAEENAFAEAL
jgi:hypothetical protein